MPLRPSQSPSLGHLARHLPPCDLEQPAVFQKPLRPLTAGYLCPRCSFLDYNVSTVAPGKFLVILQVSAQMLPLCLGRLCRAFLGTFFCTTSRLVWTTRKAIILLKLPVHEPVCPLGWELLDDLDRFFSALGLQSFGHTVRPQATFAE